MYAHIYTCSGEHVYIRGTLPSPKTKRMEFHFSGKINGCIIFPWNWFTFFHPAQWAIAKHTIAGDRTHTLKLTGF